MGIRAPIAALMTVAAALISGASGLPEYGPADTSGIQEIEISSGTLPVQVTRGDAAGIVLDSDIITAFPWDEAPRAGLRMERDGSRLYAWVEGDAGADPAAVIRVSIPDGASIHVSAQSGTVTVEGMDGGTCRVRTASGHIVMRHDRCRLSAESVSGDIEIESSNVGVRARTVSGRILARHLVLSSNSDFASVSGRIDVAFASNVEDYGFDLRSVSGPIIVGGIRTERGLRLGFGRTRVSGQTISGAISFTGTGSGGVSRP